jgi:glycolate oxidase
VALAAVDDIAQAGAVAAVISAGIIPAGLELMDQAATRAVEEFVHAKYPLDAKAVLLAESDGTPEEVAAEMAEIRRVLTEARATEVRVSKDEAQRLLFWSGRKAAFPAGRRITPDYYCMDGTIPRKALAAVLARIEELSQQYGLAAQGVPRGRRQPPSADPVRRERRRRDRAHRGLRRGDPRLCIEVGGTITGEHGVGIEKLAQMCVQFSPGELERFLTIKAAFDPDSLLNPGKGVPTLHRCAEFGKMHVHHGELPHPDIPRF